MLLKNYFTYNSLLFGKSGNMISLNGGSSVPIMSLLNANQKCLVGKGTTPAKVDDYKLEEEIKELNTTFTVNVSDSGTKIVNIISNLTNNSVTISEIGIACYQNQNSGFLMTRTVLEEPVVLEVGDIVVIETQFA